LAYIQSKYFALYFLDEECKPMTLLSCDLYDGHKYINDIFKVISKWWRILTDDNIYLSCNYGYYNVLFTFVAYLCPPNEVWCIAILGFIFTIIYYYSSTHFFSMATVAILKKSTLSCRTSHWHMIFLQGFIKFDQGISEKSSEQKCVEE
jgi:hypothetical protein